MSDPWDRLHMRAWGTITRRLGGATVVANGVTTTGMFDRQSELVLNDQVISLENALTVKTSELGNLAYGDSITVDGVAYTVRTEPMRINDGMLSVVSLQEND